MIDWKSFGSGVAVGLVGGALLSKLFGSIGRGIKGFWKLIMNATRREFNDLVRGGQYDFKEDFDQTMKDFDTSEKVGRWLRTYAPDHLYAGLQLQGQLYMFDYDDPLGAEQGTLDAWDTSPLVLNFGLVLANTGNIVEYGINLHWLPKEVRKEFMSDIFNLFKEKYDGEMYSNKPRAINAFGWEQLQEYIEKYGIDFATKAYIPQRRTHTIMFEYQDWAKATLIPSKGFAGISEKQVELNYQRHLAAAMRKRRLLRRPNQRRP